MPYELGMCAEAPELKIQPPALVLVFMASRKAAWPREGVAGVVAGAEGARVGGCRGFDV